MIIIKEIRCNQFLKSHNSLLSPITTLNRLSLSSHKFYGMHLIKSTLHNGIGQETINIQRYSWPYFHKHLLSNRYFSLWETLKMTDPGQRAIPGDLVREVGAGLALRSRHGSGGSGKPVSEAAVLQCRARYSERATSLRRRQTYDLHDLRQ